MQPVIKIAVVEDNTDIQEMVGTIIKSENQFQLTGVFSTAETFLLSLHLEKPDIVIMDLGLPAMSGVEAIQIISTQYPGIQCIVFTIHDSNQNVFEALTAGACGYLLKGAGKEKIVQSIISCFEGGSPMSSSIARKVVEIMYKKNNLIHVLSHREQDVLQGLKDGLSYHDIAQKLDISLHTVRTYIRTIYEKLQVHSKTDAINKIFKSY